MITIPISRLEISPVAKLELGKDKKRVFISKQRCPRTPEHKTCRMNLSMGEPFAVCSIEGYTRYDVRCKDCREKMVVVYAKDKSLKDWRRLHYESWHDDKLWYGLRGLNINPQTSNFLIECTCAPEVRKTPSEFIIREAK